MSKALAIILSFVLIDLLIWVIAIYQIAKAYSK